MGIIRRQSIKGSIYTYIGTLLGFLNIALLAPKIFTADQIGLTQVMVAMATLLAQFGSLGFNSVTSRLFPYFRSDEKRHNGYLFIQTVVGVVGYLLMVLLILLFRDTLIERNQEKSPLLVEYLLLLFPLLFFLLFYSLFDSYNRIIYNATLGTLLKEVLVRFGNLLIILLFYFDLISFSTYVYLFVGLFGIPPLFLAIYLLLTGNFSLKPQWGYIGKDLRKEMINVAIFGIISGFATLALVNIDKYMVSDYLGLASAGVYAIAFYFGSLILIPNRAVSKISVTVLAENWKAGRKGEIFSIYQKSCMIQFILSGLVYILLVSNLHNIFQILPAEYSDGKWVIILIGLGNMLNMLSGVSTQVINTSYIYRFQNYAMLILIGVVVVTNMIFIPRFGITGAGIAFLVSSLVFVVLKFLLLLWKFGFQPYRGSFLFTAIIISGVIVLNRVIPVMSFWPDIIIRSGILAALYVAIIYFSGISMEIRELIESLFRLVGIRLGRYDQNRESMVYVAPGYSSFVRSDLQILRKKYDLRVNTYNWTRKALTPLYLIHQLFYLMVHMGQVRAVIISSAGYWSLIPGWIGKLYGKPVYIILNGSDSSSIPSLQYGSLRKTGLRAACKWSYKFATKLLPVSSSLMEITNEYNQEAGQAEYLQGVKNHFPGLKTPYQVIHNGFDTEYWEREQGTEKKESTFIAVFSPSQYLLKGGDLIHKMALRFPESTFYLAGLDQPATMANKPDNLHFLGKVSRDRLKSYYSTCQFHLQLSIFEGFGCALSEAMLCECIPIVSRVNIMPEMVGDSGFVLDKRDEELLAKILEDALALSNKSELGKKARERIATMYPISLREELFLKLINSIGNDKE